MLIILATKAFDCLETFSLVQQVVLQLSQQLNHPCLLQKKKVQRMTLVLTQHHQVIKLH